MVAVGLALSLAATGIGFLAGGTQAHSVSGVQEVISYTVRPGDNLWTYASMVTPEGGDISHSVDELMELNNLSSPVLQTGQRIIVPNLS
ncbi:LysM peptidoglycan-binding domain-containing protein [Bombiscardovia apis]|uniref:LysM peptidoglycan-binding domain-containing protein n=1 Tax=Bombiscardovia apis TaxID=2932182 RepID=UPI0029544B40|nr:LysM peptidoglycan-binding domain-containing protein [Bombiscardovia apis]